MKRWVFLFVFVLMISTCLFSDIVSYQKTIENQKEEIARLRSRLILTDTLNDKLEILFKILEIKYINNIESEEDMRLLDELLSKMTYNEKHAKADFLTGNIMKINGAGNMSIERYYRAYKYYLNHNNSIETARLGMAIGENLRAFGEQRKALEYLYQALKSLGSADERLKMEIYDRMSAVYFEEIFWPELNQKIVRDSCEYYGLQVLKYAEKYHDHPLMISSCTILGALARHGKDFPLALQYLTKAGQAADDSGRLSDKALILSNTAGVYSDQGYKPKALELMLEAFDLAEKTKINVYILMFSQSLFEYYRSIGDYKNTVQYMDIYLKYRTTVYEEEKTRYINLTTTKLELDTKNKENELQKIKISRQNQGLTFLLILIIFSVISSLVVLFFYVKTKKLNFQLKQEHQKALQFEKIKSVYAMAVTANHELNQPLTVLKGNLEMLEMSLHNLTDKQKNYIRKIDGSYENILLILKKYQENNPVHFEIYAENDVMVIFENENKTGEALKNEDI